MTGRTSGWKDYQDKQNGENYLSRRRSSEATCFTHRASRRWKEGTYLLLIWFRRICSDWLFTRWQGICSCIIKHITSHGSLYIRSSRTLQYFNLKALMPCTTLQDCIRRAFLRSACKLCEAACSLEGDVSSDT